MIYKLIADKLIVMKNLYIFMLLVMIAAVATSCSSEKIAEKTATEFLKSKMKNPDSFKIEEITVREDTVPPYLTKELMDLAEKTQSALDKYSRYKRMSYLFAQEKISSASEYDRAEKALQDAYMDAKNEKPEVEYIVYVKYSGTNALGGTVTNKAIVIIDIKNPKEILGTFNVDKEFLNQYFIIKYVGSNHLFDIKENRYGKVDTDGMSYFDQFVFGE